MSNVPNSTEQENTVTILGEVLDLLAGIEARQKVLAREIAVIRATVEERDVDEVTEELRNLFVENLEKERNSILSRVSLLSNLPPNK